LLSCELRRALQAFCEKDGKADFQHHRLLLSAAERCQLYGIRHLISSNELLKLSLFIIISDHLHRQRRKNIAPG
jgi:hypothetical protein